MKINNKNTTDLGTGKIGILMFKLAFPAVLAQIINALYNIVDRVYIGHIEGAGTLALTGVGLTFPIIMLISAFSALVGMGGAPLAAIRMGGGENEKAEEIMGNSFVALLAFSVVLTVTFLAFKEPLLYLFGASENTIAYADEYLGVYLIGTVFVQISLGLNPFINTQGFAKTGMLTVLIGAIINIILDPILIFQFGMGVKGAALATIISQAVSAVWVLLFLFSKKSILKFKAKNLRINKKIILPVLALGLSPFAMQSTESLVNIVLNSSLQRFGGDIAVGCMTIVSSVSQLVFMPLTGLGQGAQPIMSYNFGAKQYDRVRKAFKLFLISALALTGAVWLVVMITPELLIRIFTSDVILIKEAVWSIRIFMALLFVMGVQTACQQTFLAMGQAKISLFLALLRKIILLIPLALILPHIGGLGLLGIWLSEPIADLGAASTTLFMFMRKAKTLIPPSENELSPKS